MLTLGLRKISKGEYTREQKSHIVELCEADLYLLNKAVSDLIKKATAIELEIAEDVRHQILTMLEDY